MRAWLPENDPVPSRRCQGPRKRGRNPRAARWRAIGLPGVAVPAKPHQRIAKIEFGFRKVALEAQRLPVGVGGLLKPAERKQRGARLQWAPE